MDVHVAGTPEQRIFEMVMLKIGDAVRHIGFARYERLFPQRRAIAQDLAAALDMRWQGGDQQFRAERRRPQFGMGEPQIIAAFGDMIGKLIGERKAEAHRRTVLIDQVDARNFRLLPGIKRE
ncbi:hypothetical protein D9M73_125440 [compost metagenome]